MALARAGLTDGLEELAHFVLTGSNDLSFEVLRQAVVLLATSGNVDSARRILARAWIHSNWEVPLDVLASVDMRAAKKVLEHIKPGYV